MKTRARPRWKEININNSEIDRHCNEFFRSRGMPMIAWCEWHIKRGDDTSSEHRDATKP
jgi:hypothetical protein